MLEYNIAYIVTNVIFTYSIYKLFRTFATLKTGHEKTEKISYISCYLILSLLVFATRVPIVNFICSSASIFLMSINYNLSKYKRIIVTFLICIILLVIELIISVIFGVVISPMTNNKNYDAVTALILTRIITLIIVYLLNRYIRPLKQGRKIPSVYYYSVIIILCGTLYLFISTLKNEFITINEILISGFVLIVVNVTMVFIDEKIYKSIVLENEKNILELQTNAQENQINIINQSIETVRIMKHDMKNHVLMIKNLYENGNREEAEKYVDKTLYDIENNSLSNSHNIIIDSIINFKLNAVMDKNIDIKLDICVPQVINITSNDITTILGNLLDNAINAVMKVDKKILDIKISFKMGNLIILIDNSYNGNLIYDNGKLKTTHLFKSNHGLGISSIEKVLDKYGGELHIEHTEDMFSVSVVVPCV